MEEPPFYLVREIIDKSKIILHYKQPNMLSYAQIINFFF